MSDISSPVPLCVESVPQRSSNSWDLERIRVLTRDERRTLRLNALAKGTDVGQAVAQLCDRVDEEALAKKGKRYGPPSSRDPSVVRATAKKLEQLERLLDQEIMRVVAEKLAGLPEAATIENATHRMWRRDRPVVTLGQLWQKFIECGFSSQEKSDASDALGRFITANGPLFDLDKVMSQPAPLGPWIDACLAGSGMRLHTAKRRLVEGNLSHFNAAGQASDPLAALCQAGGALRTFCDLARGTLSDADLPTSKNFSAGLDAALFPQIGHKQLRNILVNSGLAVNVVPLDSRWKKFFDGIVVLEGWMFSNRQAYLAIEDILRQALIRVQPRRPDLVNLAMVDAIVFATIKSGA